MGVFEIRPRTARPQYVADRPAWVSSQTLKGRMSSGHSVSEPSAPA